MNNMLNNKTDNKTTNKTNHSINDKIHDKINTKSSGRYLLLSDLDGTLLTTDKRVTDRTKKALAEFCGAGNVFAVCTGRDITSARLVYASLGLSLPGSCIASFNGGLIIEADTGRVLYRTALRLELVREVFRIAAGLNLHVQTYSDTHILTTADTKELQFYRKVIKTPVMIGPDVLEHIDTDPYKVICIEMEAHEKQEAFRMAVEERFGDEVSLVYSSKEYLEVIPKTSGKDQAVLRLAEALGIAPENTIAAGDADNDLTMIRAAGTGIAMKNGSPAVLEAADLVTEEDNDHDGLALALQSFIKQKR
jgi:Cof subfamily protein (haloacid dehalogenase superfamily)